MSLLEEWHYIISALRLHIAQEYPDLAIKQKVHAPPPPSPQRAPALAPKKELSPPVAKKAIPAPPKPKEVLLDIPTMPLDPVMQALCRPVAHGSPISLAGTVSALENLGVKTLPAPQDLSNAFVMPPCMIFVSFFQPKSEEEQFLQKVVSAVSERILACSFYSLAGVSCAAECFTLAASGALKGIILSYPQQEAQRLASWLAYFGQDLENKAQELDVLKSKRSLFAAPLYELTFTPAQIADAGFKRALWQCLQRVS